MPIANGAYVNPGWHNDTDPYINQTELNAISNTLQKVPIANGGTGAVTASAALTNLGAEPIANVKSKGSATTPVYFNSSGVATAITGPIPVSLGGTGVSSTAALATALKAATLATAGATVGGESTPVYVKQGVVTACTDTIKTYTGTSPITVSGTAISHAASGVTAASKGDTTAQTPTWGGTFKVPSGTVNATGHLTAFADHTVKIPNAAMTGATSTAAGAVGLVPAPAKGKQTSFLRGDGSWVVPTDTTYSATAPISLSGTTISHANSGVTAASKGDTTAQTPTWGGTFKVPSGTVNATGHLTAFADHTVKIPNAAATNSAAGLMSAADKTKLNSIGSTHTLSNTASSLANGAQLIKSQSFPAGTWIIFANGTIGGSGNMRLAIYDSSNSVDLAMGDFISLSGSAYTYGNVAWLVVLNSTTTISAVVTNRSGSSAYAAVYMNAFRVSNATSPSAT